MISRKKTVALAMVLIILFSLNGCTKITQVKKTNHTETLQMSKVNGKITPQKYTDNYGTTYEIFLSSFYDSNGDGIGDISVRGNAENARLRAVLFLHRPPGHHPRRPLPPHQDREVPGDQGRSPLQVPPNADR